MENRNWTGLNIFSHMELAKMQIVRTPTLGSNTTPAISTFLLLEKYIHALYCQLQSQDSDGHVSASSHQ